MNICKMAQEVHENARNHGWWDEDRSFGTITALICSEWAEALEEHRAGRPNVWFACEDATESGTYICAPKDEFDCPEYDNIENCKHRSKKPEGVAVELIDGCIRILDWFGRENIRIAGPNTIEKLDPTGRTQLRQYGAPGHRSMAESVRIEGVLRAQAQHHEREQG